MVPTAMVAAAAPVSRIGTHSTVVTVGQTVGMHCSPGLSTFAKTGIAKLATTTRTTIQTTRAAADHGETNRVQLATLETYARRATRSMGRAAHGPLHRYTSSPTSQRGITREAC